MPKWQNFAKSDHTERERERERERESARVGCTKNVKDIISDCLGARAASDKNRIIKINCFDSVM